MENKIQELTDKIYREGVEKGNEEAQRLISSARDEAAKKRTLTSCATRRLSS